MKFNTTKSKRKVLKNLNVNNADAIDSNNESFDLSAIHENIKNVFVAYDSDWQIAELEKIDRATSQVEGTLLPEKAKYSFSSFLNIPESVLPFLDIELSTKTTPEMVVKGVEKFTYSSQKPLMFNLYDWQGITFKSRGGSVGGEFITIPISSPHAPLPPLDPTYVPDPTECYNHEVFYSSIQMPHVGTGISAPLNKDGTKVYPGTINEDTLFNWTTNVSITYGITQATVQYGTGESVTFKFPTNNFPVPLLEGINPEDLLCGPVWPDKPYGDFQYWLKDKTVDFAGLIAVSPGATLQDKVDYATAVVQDNYDNVITSDDIIPGEPLPPGAIFLKNDNAPYKALQVVEEEAVEVGDQVKTITKVSEGNYRIDLSGYILLISKAETLTSFSDSDFPTYEPSGEDLHLRGKIYIINRNQYTNLEKYGT